VSSPWGEWSECPGGCGKEGTQSRARSLLHTPHARHLSSKKCSLELKQSRKCIVKCVSEAPKLNSNSAQTMAKEEKSAYSKAATEAAASKAAEAQAVRDLAVEAEKERARVDAAAAAEAAAAAKTAADAAVAESVSSESAASAGEAAAEEPPEDFRSRLAAFYRKYNPDKLPSVDEVLVRYAGREDVLFNSLVAKYGPEP